MKKIELQKGIEIGVKRFYLPTANFQLKCTNCGAMMEMDYSEQYLSYPVTGENEEGICCHECSTDYIFTIKLNIIVEVDEKTLEPYK